MNNLSRQYFFPMKNVIQHYSWGSKTSIQHLFNIDNNKNEPQAEIWMGAHSNGCSQVGDGQKFTSLRDFINSDKSAILGKDTAITFGELPYLFKVLAANESLSVQVHPSKRQAEIGFEQEENAGIDHTSPIRNYKDPNHKPELVYALTPYQAMNGFREYADIIKLFKKVNISCLVPLVANFELSTNEQGLEIFFSAIMSLEQTLKDSALNELLDFANRNQDDPLAELIVKLSKQHPGDIGLFTPLLLNVLTLQPKEAMYLDACTPHAYIEGTALEIMANSDNVIRAGLTHKHIDVKELVKCTKFIPKPKDSLLLPPQRLDESLFFPVPVKDFCFSILESVTNKTVQLHSAEILFAIDTEITLTHKSGQTLTVNKGESIFVPAYTTEYEISSLGRIARAFN